MAIDAMYHVADFWKRRIVSGEIAHEFNYN